MKLKIKKRKVSEKNVKRLEKLAGKAMIGRYDNFVKHAEEVMKKYEDREQTSWCKSVLLGQAGYWKKIKDNLVEAKRFEEAKEYGERVMLLRAFSAELDTGFYDVNILKEFEDYVTILKEERNLL